MPSLTTVDLLMTTEAVGGTLRAVLTGANHAHLFGEGETRRLTYKGYEVYASVHVHYEDGAWNVREGNAHLWRNDYDTLPPTHEKAVLAAIMATALPFLCDEAARRLAQVKRDQIYLDRARADYDEARRAMAKATSDYEFASAQLSNAVDMALTTKGVTSAEINDATTDPYRR